MSKEREELIEVINRPILEAMWSPASGPVVWDEEKIKAAKEQAHRLAQAALSAIEGAGYVVLPVEPTEAMINAVAQGFGPADRYRAMISAYSPKNGGGD